MKNLLICVSGLTPQIITETLFCLSIRKKICIDELFVITTSRGRNVILGKDKQMNKERGYPPLIDEIDRMCKKYKNIKNPKFKPENIKVANELSIELADIRTDDENKLFPNALCEFINEKTKDNYNILHCSISGGRKSMSVDMAFALSLFGRENDKLWHVLTHEDQEFKGFFPENKKQENDLELAEIPYVKLRSIIAEKTKNKNFNKMKYIDIVKDTQTELKKKSADKLVINISRGEIYYGSNEIIIIQPKQIKLYRYFIENNGNSENRISIHALVNNFNINRNTGEVIKQFNDTNIRQLITKLNNDRIKAAVKDPELYDIFKIQSGSYGTGEYFLNANSDNVIFID
ncbi:MAG TPA: CRISPR-associated ring nuclease Csm6 [Ignavibacteria bacterium]|nr:CRISPR-associated ring nuclease Csm6 [Ignavibacteria bacterium]HMR40312.1 CRISPR-associated ring nuclease Csm6 [Ignavibacteria bacterium]